MTGGYRGKVLRVDLTTGSVSKEDLDPDLARKYIGDFGINLRLAYDAIPAGVDPLSPQNAMVFGAGPLVGTRVQAPRWSVASKLPLSGVIACCSAGMGFGVRLKKAGYDHVVITGGAAKHVYLSISDDEVQLRDAGDLWGKDITETTDALWERLGKDTSVAAIGQAGENLVRLALAFVDKNSTLGKAGLAAVMASKNLKAVTVKGTGAVSVADPEAWTAASDRMLEAFRNDPEREHWRKQGKMHMFAGSLDAGIPYKNWTELYPREQAAERFGFDVYIQHKKGRASCTSCSNACKDVLEAKEGEFKGVTTHVASIPGRPIDLGIKFGLENYEQFIKLLDVCNRYGVCTQTFAPLADLTVELYERGIITDKDTQGFVPKRDFSTALKLVKMVAFREGFGNVLADGTYELIRRFGPEVERYSTHIKGLEQQNDSRTRMFNTYGFCQVTNPEGANIEPGHVGGPFRPNRKGFSIAAVEAYCKRMDIPKANVDRIFDVETYYNTGRLLKYAEDFFVLLTSLGICEYRTTFYDWDKLAGLYSAATGMAVSKEDMKQAGERIWNLYRAINVREGFDRKDDRIPPKWLEPLKTADGKEVPLADCGNKTVTMESLTRTLDDYYDERGWDVGRGIPTARKLAALGMDDIAKDLSERGRL